MLQGQLVRSYLTTREVRAMLGGITQQRVSQLVKQGFLVAEADDEGRLMYDRIAVERLAEKRAIKHAVSAEELEERKVVQAEARDRFERERRKKAERDEEKTRVLHEQRERTARALEGIWQCLKRQSG